MGGGHSADIDNFDNFDFGLDLYLYTKRMVHNNILAADIAVAADNRYSDIDCRYNGNHCF